MNCYGSWYAPAQKLAYGWCKGMLLQKSMTSIELVEKNQCWNEQTISTYANPYFRQGKDTLVLIRQEIYKGDELPADF
jgi:hypothetical protein